MKTLADIILGLATGLGGLLSLNSNMKRARSHDAAEVFKAMSVCLSSIADKLDRGEEPVAECHELLYYSQRVPETIRKVAGFWNRKNYGRLGKSLYNAVDAPSRVTFNFQNKFRIVQVVYDSRKAELQETDSDAEIRKIREASGLFLAASNLIRAGVNIKI